tara:strand:- start:1865 stop:1993 length:129 start_codon:yes stop_codon:yes gene_type:complete
MSMEIKKRTANHDKKNRKNIKNLPGHRFCGSFGIQPLGGLSE